MVKGVTGYKKLDSSIQDAQEITQSKKVGSLEGRSVKPKGPTTGSSIPKPSDFHGAWAGKGPQPKSPLEREFERGQSENARRTETIRDFEATYDAAIEIVKYSNDAPKDLIAKDRISQAAMNSKASSVIPNLAGKNVGTYIIGATQEMFSSSAATVYIKVGTKEVPRPGKSGGTKMEEMEIKHIPIMILPANGKDHVKTGQKFIVKLAGEDKRYGSIEDLLKAKENEIGISFKEIRPINR
jgi:hypothetical protein